MNTRKPSASSNSRDFNPPEVDRRDGGATQVGDQRGGDLYVYSEKLKLAVRVALVTGRPLLVRGPPGWGKSSLAAAIAKHKKWRYLEQVISSRTQARDLMSELDLVRRLSDAQSEGGVDPDWRRYIRPGVLWEAFNPADAELQRRYFDRREAGATEAEPDTPPVPAVVLLDEMDKADPDVPNNLLVALGSLQFPVDEISDAKAENGRKTVKALSGLVPLIIVTTNDERDLPRAFLRRCVEIELPTLDGPDQDGKQRVELLVKIAVEHLKKVKDKNDLPLDEAFVRKVAEAVVDPAVGVAGDDGLIIPSPAEFIDTSRAVGELYGTAAKKEDIGSIIGIAVRKRGVSGGA